MFHKLLVCLFVCFYCFPFFQYKEDLSSDEEIFAEKTREIESLKEHVRELEEEKAKLNNQLQETLTRLKKHEDQLFQQQLQLNQLLLHQGNAQGTVNNSFVHSFVPSVGRTVARLFVYSLVHSFFWLVGQRCIGSVVWPYISFR